MKYKQNERSIKQYNLDLLNYSELTEDFWQMPIITNDHYIPDRLIGFNEAMTSKDNDACVHFFLYDYQFERIWKDPRRYVDALKRFSGVCSPDFSLYVDMPTPIKLYNIYRSRLVGQYLQSQGIKVIPTISWGDKETYLYCFKGIPQGSIVAISTLGVRNNQTALKIWYDGYREMIKQIQPSVILIYGGKIAIAEKNIKWYENQTIKRMKGE